jgi:hypothetical protein
VEVHEDDDDTIKTVTHSAACWVAHLFRYD